MRILTQSLTHKSLCLCFTVLSCLAVSSCASQAVKYNKDNTQHLTDQMLRPQAEPLAIDEPLDIDFIRKRTLSHNSEYFQAQSQLMDTIRKAGARGKDLLPKIYASTSGNWRNNANASTGVRVDQREAGLPGNFFTAQDQASVISNFTASWDLLEIGLSSLKTNRKTIQAYSHREQNQYLCNRLMVDVENAYWRAIAYDQAKDKADWLKDRINYALDLSQKRAKDNPETKLQELMFQRELIDINRWYESIYRGLIASKADLARLMNVPAGEEFTLKSTDLPSGLGDIAQQDALSLINIAYQNRPEIRQSLYQMDITKLNNKEQLWRHLPAMRFFLSANNDSNSFILNQNFVSAGVNLSWDLMRIGQIGETKRKGERALNADQQQMQILASAVMAQVMIARTQMHKLDHDLSLAWRALSVQSKITDDLNQDVSSGDKPETYLVKEELMKELSYIREQLARAELHTAKLRLQQSIGQVPYCEA